MQNLSREVHGFLTSSWGEAPWQTLQPQSLTVVFLSVVALLAKLTCDQSTQSIVYVQDTDICQTSFSLRERVHHFDSIVQDTMKLLMSDRKCCG